LSGAGKRKVRGDNYEYKMTVLIDGHQLMHRWNYELDDSDDNPWGY
jgi:hypothetical protein